MIQKVGTVTLTCVFQEVEDIDWEDYWNPRLFGENVYGERKRVHLVLAELLTTAARATVTEKRRVSWLLPRVSELNQFP